MLLPEPAPGLDGLELCRRVRADARSGYLYIILVTVLGDRQDVLRGMEAGADDYLVKPVGLLDLQARLIAAQRVTELHAELDRHRAQLAHLARHDPLTGLGNRRSLQEDLEVLHARSQRYRRGFALAMCDIDRFKAYNDTHGHQAGDQALRAVAATITGEVRGAMVSTATAGRSSCWCCPSRPWIPHWWPSSVCAAQWSGSPSHRQPLDPVAG